MPTKARTKLACKIARINPDRLNEAVSVGRYTCAPETSPGSSRLFGVDDIVALCIYAQLIRSGVSDERAWQFSCDALREFHDKPDVEVLSRLVGANSVVLWIDQMHNPGVKYRGPGVIQSWMGFDIKELRSRVAADLDDEPTVKGEE